jgi:cytochrome c nitrite reductase small subunit
VPEDWTQLRRSPRRRITLAAFVLCAVLGVFAGTSGFTFYTAKGWSYLSNDPTSCVNCHIMREQYESWQHSSHHAFATCNDCHVPKDLVGKYLTKMENGYRHSWGFTFQDFHEPIRLHPRTPPIIQDNCLRCHSRFVSDIVGHSRIENDPVECTRCHTEVGHKGHR